MSIIEIMNTFDIIEKISNFLDYNSLQKLRVISKDFRYNINGIERYEIISTFIMNHINNKADKTQFLINAYMKKNIDIFKYVVQRYTVINKTDLNILNTVIRYCCENNEPEYLFEILSYNPNHISYALNITINYLNEDLAIKIIEEFPFSDLICDKFIDITKRNMKHMIYIILNKYDINDNIKESAIITAFKKQHIKLGLILQNSMNMCSKRIKKYIQI